MNERTQWDWNYGPIRTRPTIVLMPHMTVGRETTVLNRQILS